MDTAIPVEVQRTKLTQETNVWPKPMVEIVGKSTFWHFKRLYSLYGFNDQGCGLGIAPQFAVIGR